ncbi:MAG: hypothetical protein V5A55_06465 [Halovenus sp.]
MERDRLQQELEAAFGGSDKALRVVSRQARDLADAGRIEADFGYTLTVEAVCSHLADAPDDHSLVQRWNWWIGSLELSHGDYQRFRVRPDIGQQG